MTQYVFSTLIYPGAAATYANGINETGEIVGRYTDASNSYHGFIYNAGTFSSYDFPGSRATYIDGVNATGEIVGQYQDASSFNLLGFVVDGGIATTLNYPGSTATTANKINASGAVVGTYLVGANQHGFLYQNGAYTPLDYPGTTGTLIGGINDVGDVAGIYQNRAVSHGFITQNGALVAIDYSAATSTQANAFNNTYEVAGTFAADGRVHGFTEMQGVYSQIDVPGATSTVVLGIDDLGDVVGVSTNANGITTGFLGTPVCFVTGTRIRTTRGDCAVEDLVVGDVAVTASGETRPIVWIGHRDTDCRANHDLHPVRVAAHAFGADLPARDLWLSPGHPVLVGAGEDNKGGHLVPIMCLVNGTTIARMAVDAVTYWHVELDAHDILLAEDLPAEIYLDWSDRAFFIEGFDHALANPDFIAPGLAGRCRPVAVDGCVVEAERQRLDAVFATRLADACVWPSDMSFNKIKRSRRNALVAATAFPTLD